MRRDLASSSSAVGRAESPPRKRVKQVSRLSSKPESHVATARRVCPLTCCPKYRKLPAPDQQDKLAQTSEVFRKLLGLNGGLKASDCWEPVDGGLPLRCSELLSVCGPNSSVCVRGQDIEGGAEHLVCHLVTEHDHDARAAAEAVLSLVIDQASECLVTVQTSNEVITID